MNVRRAAFTRGAVTGLASSLVVFVFGSLHIANRPGKPVATTALSGRLPNRVSRTSGRNTQRRSSLKGRGRGGLRDGAGPRSLVGGVGAEARRARHTAVGGRDVVHGGKIGSNERLSNLTASPTRVGTPRWLH
ncbi:hypothetical protein DFP72DRAFT_117693 [Ephemerocybe angulata]|uniref:Uncharacterized protein n=1 Tax=Ephemerocybe angulata TaxID=980116 RepID=A0A8H6I6I5_9AGAR|nr:hypothetical protein DFP72DRAFT_117693 [Tulosesus angulatus]